MIRKITKDDICRLAEICVFNNRMYYYPIFNDINFSFKYLNVFDVSKDFLKDEFQNNTYLFEEEDIIKGFILLDEKRVDKLYVDPFFHNQGIGHKLLNFAIENYDVDNLWCLEKNINAQRFYNCHGFIFNGEKRFEDGTNEYLIHLIRHV